MVVEYVKFLSNPRNYEKEEIGLKPNTIRKPNPDEPNDERFKMLEEFANEERNILGIEIQNTLTGASFKRAIEDVSFYNGYYIISWKHESR